ncbi:hypothetical protein JCM10449v2_000395 [Rhodotorula kratochvilovae]
MSMEHHTAASGVSRAADAQAQQQANADQAAARADHSGHTFMLLSDGSVLPPHLVAPAPPSDRDQRHTAEGGEEVAADAPDKIEAEDDEEEEEDEDADQATAARRPVYPHIDPRTPNSRAVLMSSDGDPLASYLSPEEQRPAEERAAARPLADEDEPLSDVFLSSTVSTLPLASPSTRSEHDSAKAGEADEEGDDNEGQENKSKSAGARHPVYPVLADPSNPNSMAWAISLSGGLLVCGLSPEEQHAEWVKEQETERIQQDKEKQAAEAREMSG